MEISHIETFLAYLERVHERTRRLVVLIPVSALEWAPRTGAFTCGDLVRHLAGIERFLYAENAHGRANRYPGHDRSLADGWEAVVEYYDRCHAESMTIFGSLDTPSLMARQPTPAGALVPVWKFLRAMIEHEVHHRGQLYLMLSLLGVATPPIYGMREEELVVHPPQRGVHS